ncbi:Colicin V production protein [Novipirellula galeiformis]|uniref:Colicin V production protein n=1 Tax=Novipirellula galeiformis TaxID=2528004 RepID=A0A5C6CN77_9BACT|nr:CvpA family protein [Novipirellula galeiformis]TWU26413.1 Colicin V production protein [Novipirellula galeiformis]
MEIYDIMMLVVLIGALVFGAIKGFAWQLASIASIVVSYMVAYHYREPFSQSIHAEPPWNRFLAMLILYVGTSLVVWVAFRMVSGTIDRFKLREFDRQIGAMFGLAKGALYCILITLFAVTLFGENVREKIVGSKSGNYIASVLARSESVIPPEIQEVVQPYLDRFEKRFNSDDAQEMPAGFLEGVRESMTRDAANGVLPESLWDDGSGAPAGRAPLPVDPRGWNSGQSVPQQAQQPWNGFQR